MTVTQYNTIVLFIMSLQQLNILVARAQCSRLIMIKDRLSNTVDLPYYQKQHDSIFMHD